MVHQEEKSEIHQNNQILQQPQKEQNQQSFQPPIRVGKFTFSEQDIIGKGSFSKVYLGHNQSNHKHQVAIKVIQKHFLNDDLKTLVDTQIKILRLVNHPNIVKCHEIKEDDQNIYVIMQLCQGGDLESKVDKYGPISEEQAIPIIKDVFNGLLYLSWNNIIHRDIKVANIFLQNGQAKIADFGFAIHSKTKKQFQDITIGSPIYMSPQGIKHSVYGPTTDVWSFGVFVYELLHGKTPYSHCTKQRQLKYNISNQIGWYNLKPSLSYSVKQVIYKCLEINYEKRITFQKLKQLSLFKQYDKDLSQCKQKGSQIRRFKSTKNIILNNGSTNKIYQKGHKEKYIVQSGGFQDNFNSPVRKKKQSHLNKNMQYSQKTLYQPTTKRNYIKKITNRNQNTNIDFQFSQQTNINSYLFVIHFTRLLYKLTSCMRKYIIVQHRNKDDFIDNKNKYKVHNYPEKSSLEQIKINLQQLCLQLLRQAIIRKEHFIININITNLELNYNNNNNNQLKRYYNKDDKYNCYCVNKDFKFNYHYQQQYRQLEQQEKDHHIIHDTLNKYYNQYKTQFNTSHNLIQNNIYDNTTNDNHFISNFNNININYSSINTKLQKQMNFILTKEIKKQTTNKPQNGNNNKNNVLSVKLLYYAWLYNVYFDKVSIIRRFLCNDKDNNIMKKQLQRQLINNLGQRVKQLQMDIQQGNKILRLQSYLKIKINKKTSRNQRDLHQKYC